MSQHDDDVNIYCFNCRFNCRLCICILISLFNLLHVCPAYGWLVILERPQRAEYHLHGKMPNALRATNSKILHLNGNKNHTEKDIALLAK